MTVRHTHTYLETVAVLGAGGTMGFPIARNLARAGIPVRAWNRSRYQVEPLTRDGIRIADTPADAARGAGIVITILADGEAVAEAMDGPDRVPGQAWASWTRRSSATASQPSSAT